MSKTRTTVSLDEGVFRAVKVRAARTGKRDSEVIEEAIRRDLGLDALADIWAKVTPAAEQEGQDLAASELRSMRKEKRDQGGS
jgi:gamma-glutamyl:cysteine ligase YbdK (ATP-grasp superfamily)